MQLINNKKKLNSYNILYIPYGIEHGDQ